MFGCRGTWQALRAGKPIDSAEAEDHSIPEALTKVRRPTAAI